MLLGFRDQTIDIDLKMDPEPAGVFEAIATLKNELDLNVKVASPEDFIPVPSNWREKSRSIESVGELEFFHFDFSAQALAKLERGLATDLEDVRAFVRRGHLTAAGLSRAFDEIAPRLIRYPAIDPAQFKRKLDEFLLKLKASR